MPGAYELAVVATFSPAPPRTRRQAVREKVPPLENEVALRLLEAVALRACGSPAGRQACYPLPGYVDSEH